MHVTFWADVEVRIKVLPHKIMQKHIIRDALPFLIMTSNSQFSSNSEALGTKQMLKENMGSYGGLHTTSTLVLYGRSPSYLYITTNAAAN